MLFFERAVEMFYTPLNITASERGFAGYVTLRGRHLASVCHLHLTKLCLRSGRSDNCCNPCNLVFVEI